MHFPPWGVQHSFDKIRNVKKTICTCFRFNIQIWFLQYNLGFPKMLYKPLWSLLPIWCCLARFKNIFLEENVLQIFRKRNDNNGCINFCEVGRPQSNLTLSKMILWGEGARPLKITLSWQCWVWTAREHRENSIIAVVAYLKKLVCVSPVNRLQGCCSVQRQGSI